MSFCTTRFHLSTEICNIRLPHPIFSGLNMDAEESKGQIPIRHKRRVKSYLKFTFLQHDIIKQKPPSRRAVAR